MGVYTKIDKQLDNYYEIVDLNEKLSKQNYYLKICVLSLFICYIFVFIKCFIQPSHNPIVFFFRRYFI